MLGQSIYVSRFDESFIPEKNIDFYFTSMHIAEEFNDEFKDKATKLLKVLNDYNKKIILDISPRGVEALGFKDIYELLDNIHIDVLRLDFGFSEEEILNICDHITIGINASTNDYSLAQKIKEKGNRVIAIHNFYPRPETGLDEDFFIKRNKQLSDMGIELMAFIQGEDLRGPLFEGLPTLESQRNMKPYVAYMEMKYLYNLDNILVGDLGISSKQIELISAAEKDNIILLPCTINEKYHEYLNRDLTVRDDSPDNLLRIKESRMYASFNREIEPENTVERTKGSITVDNIKYLRYSGELQICKKDYPICEKVNVIGHIDDEYLSLLNIVNRGSRIRLINSNQTESV